MRKKILSLAITLTIISINQAFAAETNKPALELKTIFKKYLVNTTSVLKKDPLNVKLYYGPSDIVTSIIDKRNAVDITNNDGNLVIAESKVYLENKKMNLDETTRTQILPKLGSSPDTKYGMGEISELEPLLGEISPEYLISQTRSESLKMINEISNRLLSKDTKYKKEINKEYTKYIFEYQDMKVKFRGEVKVDKSSLITSMRVYQSIKNRYEFIKGIELTNKNVKVTIPKSPYIDIVKLLNDKQYQENYNLHNATVIANNTFKLVIMKMHELDIKEEDFYITSQILDQIINQAKNTGSRNFFTNVTNISTSLEMDSYDLFGEGIRICAKVLEGENLYLDRENLPLQVSLTPCPKN
jgi:hypothetical protein